MGDDVHVYGLRTADPQVLANFERFLATRDMKLTPERRAIAELTLNQHGPFSGESIVQALSNHDEASRSTVYRTLSLLTDAGLLEASGAADAAATTWRVTADLSSFNSQPSTIFPMLRQQWEREGQKDFRSLADYIAPADSGRQDYIGAFALTAGIGCDELANKFADEQHDDYLSIMTKALADRLAEAFAEMLHAKARRDWGYGAEEQLSQDEMIAEKYRGIRPAYGYPACPDHTEKPKLFELLHAEETTGIHLTENYAMHPAAAVSGLYFAHLEARYFAVDKLTKDQVEDYARRKGMPISEVERRLSPNLGYE